jgi:hypothetical protein
LFDLPDDIATKRDFPLYSDVREALLKALLE